MDKTKYIHKFVYMQPRPDPRKRLSLIRSSPNPFLTCQCEDAHLALRLAQSRAVDRRQVFPPTSHPITDSRLSASTLARNHENRSFFVPQHRSFGDSLSPGHVPGTSAMRAKEGATQRRFAHRSHTGDGHGSPSHTHTHTRGKLPESPQGPKATAAIQ
jgi:hypothetical protein